MNRPYAIASFTAVLTLTCSVPAASLPLTRFDRMSIESQSEFIAALVDVTERTLRERGAAEAADKMAPLFADIRPGDTMPIGLIVLEANIDNARLLDLERAEKDPNAQRLEVEHALLLTLKRMGVEIPPPIGREVMSLLVNFHDMTYAEFQSMAVADQRRYLVRIAQLGVPHFEMSELAEKISKKEATRDPAEDKARLEQENDIIRRSFPADSLEQPGFDAVALKIRDESARHPDDPGVFYEVLMYVLRQGSAESLRQMRDLENNTFHLGERR